jgi:cytochrome c-type biogenesis protein CcmH/NrfF
MRFLDWSSRPPSQSSKTGPRFSGHAARLVQALLLAFVVCFSVGATDPQARFNDLGHKMMCTCGCGQVLLECNHVGCTVSGGMRDELSQGIASGMNDSLVLQSFVQRYGATVLAAPTTEGFDLVAWIMPFAVSAVALIGTILLVRNWAKNQAQVVASGSGVDASQIGVQGEMRERIRRETDTE